MLGYDFVISEEAFRTAATQLNDLAGELTALKNQINGLLVDLREGWQTDAGTAFFKVMSNNLFTPIERQSAVIALIAQNLQAAQTEYQQIFSEYDKINAFISKSN